MKDIPEEAQLAYAIMSELDGQVFEKANAVAMMTFSILHQNGLMVLVDGVMRKSALVAEMEGLAKTAVTTKVSKLSICPCGFHVLADDIPLGAVYQVVPKHRAIVSFTCGGCGKVYPKMEAVYVMGKEGRQGGYLPAEIFESESGQQALAT